MHFLIFSLILNWSGFTANSDVVFVEFTKATTFDDLVRTRADLAKMGITFEYLLIEFTEQGQLKGLSFTADSRDSTSGSGICTRFLENHRLTFMRDFSPSANPSIRIASGPAQQ